MSLENPTIESQETDETKNPAEQVMDRGRGVDAQIDEIYVKRYEANAEYHRQEMLRLEGELNKAQTEEQKQAILKQIEEVRETAQDFTAEAKKRRQY